MKGDYSAGYDENSPLYTEQREKRRSKSQKHPHSTGVVVNRENTAQKPNDTTSVAPDLYIPPPQVKPTSPSQEPSSHQNSNQETQDSGEKHRPIKRGVTFDSLREESLKSIDKSAVERKPTINTGFPPVFTWPVSKRSSEPSDGVGHQVKGSNIESPDPDSAKNLQTLHEETEAQHTHEEIIKHVSTHIDGELRESVREDSKIVYNETTEMSFFQVDKAIIERLGIPISFLMMTGVGKAKGVSDQPPWKQDLKEIVSSLCRLFNFFVPLAYPCVIGNKFWGAIHDLITMIPQICDKSQILKLTKGTRHSRVTTAFYIVNIRDEQYADLRDKSDLDLLIKDVTHCDECDRSREYSKKSDAWDHLFKRHFSVSSEERAVISSRSQWVMDREQYLTFIYRRDGQKLLDELKDYVSSLERMATQIQHGVSVNGELDRDTYRIPSSLVDAFQSFVMMVVTGAHAVKTLYQTRKKYAESDPHPPSTFLEHHVSYSAANFANEAEVALETAIRDIILMTFTNEKSEVVSYEAMSPSLVIALIMGDIRSRDSQGNPVNLVETFEQYIQVLQFKAGQRPNRRLMQEIYIVREELLMVEKITKEQHQILTDYCDVLRPDTFRITTESRISSFEIESIWLQKLIDGTNDDLDLIEALLDRLESIATQTRNGVEVRQEDQGKAILVFTIMTVVFMPLSFITGYFGMNTEDIRNMGSSQTLFWTVSIPFTVVIISAVLLVAFQADRLREAFDALLSHDDVPMVRPVDSFPAEKQAPEREKKELEAPHSVEPSEKRWFARRRVANWKAASQDSSFA
ncbi:Mg2+ transporter protein CorA-like/Zinc transport protein ZntB [Penicillium frequentans]|nr:Mg2+ transporter protein CorA-like/Zinc transport protein ZntB [Penicillium glabrum]